MDGQFIVYMQIQLCRLLEADQGLNFARQKYTREHKRAERRFTINETHTTEALVDQAALEGSEEYIDLRNLTQTIEDSHSSQVTYDAFCTRYWPHFPQRLTKGLGEHIVASLINATLIVS